MLTLHREMTADDLTIEPPSAPALMTAAELAAEMQITERTIRRLSLRGKIGPKPLQIGRAVRYRRDEVARWIACGCPDRDTWRGMTRDR